MKYKFEFEIEVEIPEEEIEDFVYVFQNKRFDFFRYLADNQAKIKQTNNFCGEHLGEECEFNFDGYCGFTGFCHAKRDAPSLGPDSPKSKQKEVHPQ